MTAGEISELAKPASHVEPYKHVWLGDYRIQRRRSTVWVSIAPWGLEAYRIATDQLFPPKSVLLSTRKNLCTGAETVTLEILTDKEYVGAAVMVDGVPTTQVDSSMITRLEIPLGTHEIRLEKKGLPALVRVVEYSGSVTSAEGRLELTTAVGGEK